MRDFGPGISLTDNEGAELAPKGEPLNLERLFNCTLAPGFFGGLGLAGWTGADWLIFAGLLIGAGAFFTVAWIAGDNGEGLDNG